MTFTVDIPEFISVPHLILCGDEAEGLGISYLTISPSSQQVASIENVKKLKSKLNKLAAKHGPSSVVMCVLWALMIISIGSFLTVVYMSLSFIYLSLPMIVYTIIPPLIRSYRRSLSNAVYEAWEAALPDINLQAQKDGFVVLIFRESHQGLYHGLYKYKIYVAEASTPLPMYEPSDLEVPPPVYLTLDMHSTV